MFVWAMLAVSCGNRTPAIVDASVAGAEAGVPANCHGPGRYEAGKNGEYRPCCPGLRETFYQLAAYGEGGTNICASPPLRVYACVEGRCGDGVCEVGEAEKCGCAADCPSAVWGDVPTGELGSTPPTDAAGPASCPNLGPVATPICVDAPNVNSSRIAVATVTETSSTNSDGYTFTLYDDGSAEGSVASLSRTRAISREACHLERGTALVLTCLDWLSQADGISKIPVTSLCPKSISFGTRTFITYEGASTGDLQCVDGTQYSCGNFKNCTALLGVPKASYPQTEDGGVPKPPESEAGAEVVW